jgi:hypothetical protein
MCVCVYEYIPVCMYSGVYVYMYVCMYICMDACILDLAEAHRLNVRCGSHVCLCV